MCVISALTSSQHSNYLLFTSETKGCCWFACCTCVSLTAYSTIVLGGGAVTIHKAVVLTYSLGTYSVDTDLENMIWESGGFTL